MGNASSLTRCASAVHPPRESSRRFRVDPLVNVFPRGSIGLSAIARPHRARGLVVHAGDAKVLVPSEGDTAAELVDYLNASWTHYHAVGEPSYRCLSLVSCAPSPALSALSTSPWAAAESKAMLLAAGFEQVSEREVISAPMANHIAGANPTIPKRVNVLQSGATRRCSVGAGHASLWYCSGGYTARRGGALRETLYTVALR